MTEQTKEVWIVVTNTDLTEGKGRSKILAFCEIYATAKRLARGEGVMGSDALVWSTNLIKPEGSNVFLGPVDIEAPTEADKKLQARFDAHEAAVEKAKAAGLSEEEITAIQERTI